MSTTYTVTYRCDDGRAPGCRIRLVHESEEVRRLDQGLVRAERAGWRLGFRPDAAGVVRAYDLCPACAGLPER